MSQLQKEIKQKVPFKSKEVELFLNLARTSEALKGKVEEFLKQFELTGVQYNTLRILRGAGAEGLICNEISDRLVTKDSDITRLLNRLENRGLIARERDPNDRRHVITKITDAGLKLVDEVSAPLTELHRGHFAHLSEDLIDQLNALLVLARSQVK